MIFMSQDLPKFERFLGDGSQFRISFSYQVRPPANGVAQAFILKEEFVGGDLCAGSILSAVSRRIWCAVERGFHIE